MSDYENAMSAGPGAALKRTVNAFRAGRAEAAPPAAAEGQGPAWDAVRARIAAMGADQKALAARQAEILTVAGQGLAGRSYAERKAILAHMAPHLAALGVNAEGANGFDPSDRNLAQAVGEAVILRGMLGDSSAPGATATSTVPAPAPTAPTSLSPGAPPPHGPVVAAG